MSKKRQRQAKHENVLELVQQHVEAGTYLDTRHATQRKQERNIALPEMLFVLRGGFHEKRKDKFDELHNAWNYAVRGKTVDNRPLRVIVSFDPDGMLIITAIDLDE